MFHVGGARSALFNWAVAKRAGGIFVLRIEDTDLARNKPEWTDGILTAMAALGMHSEDPTFEGPYFQTQNLALHSAAAVRLFDEGKAYYCECAREQVVARSGDERLGYDGFCRSRGLTYEPGRALRFRTPDSGETVVTDLIRGTPSFPNAAMEDFVIARGDGTPLFLLANVVDDIDERVTHVIRGEEHLPNTPKQQLLWQALGVRPPAWAHLPVIVNEQRKKLSKRRDKVAFEDFLADGILPDAMVNYLMLLGWSVGNDAEIQPFDALVERFDIADVNSSSAFFDVKKLLAFNGEYIRALSLDAFVELAHAWLVAPHASWEPSQFDEAAFRAVAPFVQQRATTLAEIAPAVEFLFLDEPVIDEPSWAKTMTDAAGELLHDIRAAFGGLGTWSAELLKDVVLVMGERHGIKLGKAQAPVRVATTGRTVGLPLFESLEVLGRERTLARIDKALERLGGMPA
jgi:glutamyl-tRNA synthetase